MYPHNRHRLFEQSDAGPHPGGNEPNPFPHLFVFVVQWQFLTSNGKASGFFSSVVRPPSGIKKRSAFSADQSVRV